MLLSLVCGKGPAIVTSLSHEKITELGDSIVNMIKTGICLLFIVNMSCGKDVPQEDRNSHLNTLSESEVMGSRDFFKLNFDQKIVKRPFLAHPEDVSYKKVRIDFSDDGQLDRLDYGLIAYWKGRPFNWTLYRASLNGGKLLQDDVEQLEVELAKSRTTRRKILAPPLELTLDNHLFYVPKEIIEINDEVEFRVTPIEKSEDSVAVHQMIISKNGHTIGVFEKKIFAKEEVVEQYCRDMIKDLKEEAQTHPGKKVIFDSRIRAMFTVASDLQIEPN